MNEFIKKLIERLEEYCKPDCDGDCTKCHFTSAVGTVNQLAEEYNNGWIPCSERYPTTEEYILLLFTNFSVPVVGRWEEDKEGGAFYIGDDTESCVSQGLIVNAWQQLPPVYQPKGE